MSTHTHTHTETDGTLPTGGFSFQERQYSVRKTFALYSPTLTIPRCRNTPTEPLDSAHDRSTVPQDLCLIQSALAICLVRNSSSSSSRSLTGIGARVGITVQVIPLAVVNHDRDFSRTQNNVHTRLSCCQYRSGAGDTATTNATRVCIGRPLNLLETHLSIISIDTEHGTPFSFWRLGQRDSQARTPGDGHRNEDRRRQDAQCDRQVRGTQEEVGNAP